MEPETLDSGQMGAGQGSSLAVRTCRQRAWTGKVYRGGQVLHTQLIQTCRCIFCSMEVLHSRFWLGMNTALLVSGAFLQDLSHACVWLQVRRGVMADDCGLIVQQFFQRRRLENRLKETYEEGCASEQPNISSRLLSPGDDGSIL
jgi:hypothetical protein